MGSEEMRSFFLVKLDIASVVLGVASDENGNLLT